MIASKMPLRGYKSSSVASKSSKMPSRPPLGPEKSKKNLGKKMKTLKIQVKSRSQPDGAKSRQDASETAWGTLKMAPTWPPELPRRLQDGPGSLQDASHTPPGPPQDLPRRLQDRPQRAPRRPQNAPRPSKTAQGGCESPPRALQETFWRPQAASKSSPEEALETPSRVQELSPRAFQASSCCPAPASLWPASGLGGMREAVTINDLTEALVLCMSRLHRCRLVY